MQQQEYMIKREFLNGTKNYVNNEEFYTELKEWIKQRKLDKSIPITESITKKLIMIVEGYSCRPNFMNYTFRDKMISEGIYTCIRYADRFDYKKYNNPFAYFTRIAWSSFVKIILSERKTATMKKELVDKFYIENSGNMQNIKQNDNKFMFSCDYTNEEIFQPITLTFQNNDKIKIFNTQEAWNKYCKKMKKEKKLKLKNK
jgi:hypothetical protein